MERDGHLVFYSIGNFVFDQTWSEATMEGCSPSSPSTAASWSRSS